MSRKKKKPLNPPAALQLDRYGEWLEFFFGRLKDDDDPWKMEWEFEASADEQVDLMTFMLENAGANLAIYSNQQLAIGLNVLFMGYHSDIPHTISHKNINDQKRHRLVRALKPLYIDCLCTCCPRVLAQFDEAENSSLGDLVYMLWDVSSLGHHLVGLQTGHNGNSILVETFGEILLHTPANPACLESILHGLGHMAFSHPNQQRQIIKVIDQFLKTRPITRPELKDYAEAAKQGSVQ